jgi:hypothetical protein
VHEEDEVKTKSFETYICSQVIFTLALFTLTFARSFFVPPLPHTSPKKRLNWYLSNRSSWVVVAADPSVWTQLVLRFGNRPIAVRRGDCNIHGVALLIAD